MAVSLVSHEVSDLCIGKPALKSLPLTATVGDAIVALKRCDEAYLSVWTTDRSLPEKKNIVGKICMVDVFCYLCAESNISSPASALKNPVSVLLPKDGAIVRRVERNSSILESLDVILGGADSLVVPIRFAGGSRKKLPHSSGGVDFCWVSQEDLIRFFFNSISLFSPIPALSVTFLGLVRTDVLAIRHDDPALSALPLIRTALVEQTSVAVVTDDGKLIGEISPATLACCDETVTAALAALSAGDLMAYIDCYGAPPESAVRRVKAKLREKGMEGMLELMEEGLSSPLFSSGSSSSASSSSDEESPARRQRRRGLRSGGKSGSYLARMGRRSEEAIVCHPGSSLVAVMVQALAHRVSYVWVVEEDDYGLVGIVAFRDVLKVFREQLHELS